MWLNKASLLHLPLLELFKQDATVPSSEPRMLTFASIRWATVQFLILMLPWPNSRLRGLDLQSHLRLQACMFSLTFCIFWFILVMHSSCSGLHDWYWEPAFASHIHEPRCLFCAWVASAKPWNPVRGAQVASGGECFLQLTAGGMTLGGQLLRLQKKF